MSILIGDLPLIGLNVFSKTAISMYNADKLDVAFSEAVASKSTDSEELTFIVETLMKKGTEEENKARMKKLAFKCCELKNTKGINVLLKYFDNTTLFEILVKTFEYAWAECTHTILSAVLIAVDSIPIVRKLLASNVPAQKGINTFASTMFKSEVSVSVLAFEMVATLVTDETVRREICVYTCKTHGFHVYISDALLKVLSNEIKHEMAMNVCNLTTLLVMHKKGMNLSGITVAICDTLVKRALEKNTRKQSDDDDDVDYDDRDEEECLVSTQVIAILMLTERAPPLSDQAIASLVAIAIRADNPNPRKKVSHESLTIIFSDKIPRANTDIIKESMLDISAQYGWDDVLSIALSHFGAEYRVKRSQTKNEIYKIAMTKKKIWTDACALTLKLDTREPISQTIVSECFYVIVKKKKKKKKADMTMSPFINDLIERGLKLKDGDLQLCIPSITLGVLKRIIDDKSQKLTVKDRDASLTRVVSDGLLGEDTVEGVALFLRTGSNVNSNKWAILTVLKFTEPEKGKKILRIILKAADEFFSDIKDDKRATNVAEFGTALDNIIKKSDGDIFSIVIGEIQKHKKIALRNGSYVVWKESYKK
jgi:hypothetical protein